LLSRKTGSRFSPGQGGLLEVVGHQPDHQHFGTLIIKVA
jgi:hypothetical protein